MMRFSILAIALGLCLSLAACKGADVVKEIVNPGPGEPEVKEMVITIAQEADDGYARDKPANQYDFIQNSGIVVGDMFGSQNYARGLLRFDLVALAGKEIVGARLVLTQDSTIGDPWGEGDGLHLERLNLFGSLQGWHYLAAAQDSVLPKFPGLVQDETTVEWDDIKDLVTKDVATDLQLDLRLRFADVHMPTNYVRFHDASAEPGKAPQLIVQYKD